MINSKFLIETTSQLLNEMNKLKIKFTDKISELNQIIESQNENLNKLKIKFADKISELNKLIETQNENLIKMKTQEEENKKQVESLLNTINENNNKEIEKFRNLFEKFKEQMIEENQEELGDLVKKFSATEDYQFAGIIKYLQNNSTENINNILNITSSSLCNNSSTNKPQNVINYSDNKSFMSANYPNSWIRFDFKNHRIIPTNYTIKTSQPPYTYTGHPKSWVIEGSTDQSSWEIIDTVDVCLDLNGVNRVHNFSIAKQCANNLDTFKCVKLGKIGVIKIT